MNIDIIPKERDLKAKQMYLFMRWFTRKHKHLIQKKAENAIWLMAAYGDGAMETAWDEFHDH